MRQQHKDRDVDKALFEFLVELIDIQIKKYYQLALRGVGPDARPNSRLVRNEVNELFVSAKQLLAALGTENKVLCEKIVNQALFYLQCEYKRNYASTLLDENNIHGAAYERIPIQMKAIVAIKCQAHWSKFDNPFDNPVTEVQKQCRYESCLIVTRALQLAIDIQANPDMTWDTQVVPEHAQQVLRRNQKNGRYERLAEEINTLYQDCNTIMEQSDKPEPSVREITPEAAMLTEGVHKKMLEQLLSTYQQKEPKSSLFDPDKQWYDVGKKLSTLSKPLTSSLSCRFFVATAIPVLLLGSLTAWILQSTEECDLKPGL